MNIAELNTYANDISKDSVAVKNGIILSYNNGFTEGSVKKSRLLSGLCMEEIALIC